MKGKSMPATTYDSTRSASRTIFAARWAALIGVLAALSLAGTAQAAPATVSVDGSTLSILDRDDDPLSVTCSAGVLHINSVALGDSPCAAITAIVVDSESGGT